MPTYAWTRTREQMRDMILRKLGVLGAGQTAQADDAAIVYEAMDARLKELHSLGVLWWQVAASSTLSMTAGQATTTVGGSDFLFPVSLMLPVGTDQQPVEIIGHRQYQAIPDKTQQGQPECAYFLGSTVYLWPVPNVNYSAKLTYHAIAADVENGGAPDVPVSMMRSLAAVVAADLLDDFNVDATRAARLAAGQATALRTIRALNQERVDATSVTPEWF